MYLIYFQYKTFFQFSRTQDIKTKKQHIPIVDRTPLEPPPIVVAIVGPPKVGKSTLLQCIVKNFTKQRLANVQGPVTVVSGMNFYWRLIVVISTSRMDCWIHVNQFSWIAHCFSLFVVMWYSLFKKEKSEMYYKSDLYLLLFNLVY